MRIDRPDRLPDLTVRVLGEPGTAGSKVSGVAYRKDGQGNRVPMTTADGRIKTFTKDSSGAKGQSWRTVVAETGGMMMDGRERFAGPVYVEMTFLRARGIGHYGSGRNAHRLRAGAPAFPSVRPDVLKHARAVEDALTGIVWADDSRIVAGVNEKVFAERDEPLGVIVRVWALPASIGEVWQMQALSLEGAA